MKPQKKSVPKENRERIRRILIKLLTDLLVKNQKLQTTLDEAVESITEIFEHKDLKNPKAVFCPPLLEYPEERVKLEKVHRF